MFSRLAWVGAQDAEIASRFISLGVPEDRVTLTGSMKWDTAAVADTVNGAGELARALGIANDRPMLVCGSTGPGEEEVVLEAFERLSESGRRIRLAIVPRKPERFEEVARLIATRTSGCLRRSEHADGTEADTDCVILGDTMGELRKFYSLATVVFVGRSLVPMGGSDPMEAAALGKPVIAGPHMDNFRQPRDALQDGLALSTVRSADEMAETVGRICDQPAEVARAGKAARRVVIEHQGATDITVNALTKLLTPG
jgi:3-deoxy-D-manno-octulosonic-acid transferase